MTTENRRVPLRGRQGAMIVRLQKRLATIEQELQLKIEEQINLKEQIRELERPHDN